MKVKVNIDKKTKLKVGDTFLCNTSSKENVLRKIDYSRVSGLVIVIRYEKGDVKFYSDIDKVNKHYAQYTSNIRKVKVTELTVNCEEL